MKTIAEIVGYVEYSNLVATTKPRKCPMCGVSHYWPTEDKLCYVCEGSYADEMGELYY